MINFYPPKGRQLVVDEVIAHLQFAMETNDLEYTEYLTSLIHHHEIVHNLNETHPLRVYLAGLGYFRPIITKYKKIELKNGERHKGKTNRKFNPKLH